jgi:hypothetical protein
VSPAETRLLSEEASGGSSNKFRGPSLLYEDGVPLPRLKPRQLFDALSAIANSGKGSLSQNIALAKLLGSSPSQGPHISCDRTETSELLGSMLMTSTLQRCGGLMSIHPLAPSFFQSLDKVETYIWSHCTSSQLKTLGGD